MSSLKASRRGVLALAALVAVTLAGCTVAPLHDGGRNAGPTLAYADPSSRLEQVFYQALAARLGTSRSELALRVTASVSTSATRVGLSTRPGPATDYQVVATVNYRVEREGEVLASGRRTATSGYRTTGQVLADDIAAQNAGEDAVRAAAQSVIAALLADPALR